MKMLPLLLLLSGCLESHDGGALGEEGVVIVDHGRMSCINPLAALVCWAVAPDGTDDFGPHFGLVGLDAQLGHRYRVRVREERIANPGADHGGITHYADEVLSDELVPQDSTFRFRMAQFAGEFNHLTLDSATMGHLTDGTRFTGSAELVSAIAAALEGEAPFDVVFGYDADYRLVVADVER